MEEGVDWINLYLDKCKENKDLKREIETLQAIVRLQLPVIEQKI